MRTSTFMRMAVLCAVAGLGACQESLELPESGVCYGDHIQPLIKRDCAACHEEGEWGVRLRGDDRDFPEVQRYVFPGASDGSIFLWYAEGFNGHPIIWTKNSAEYRSFAGWVNEGARFVCGVPEDLFGGFDAGYDAGSDASEQDLAGNEVTPDSNPPADLNSDVVPLDVIQDTLPDIADVAPDLPPDLPPDIPDIQPDLTPVPLSFSKDISPLHKSGCKSCHGGGQNGVKIVGDASDYTRVMKYVDPSNPDVTAWEWASGYGRHKNLYKWGKTGANYLLFLQWVKEGAQNN